jgi:putative transposase
MSSTFAQLYAHIIFSVRGKKAFISQDIEAEVFEYITRLADKLGHKILIINGTSDHIHLLIKFNPAVAISDLVREIKRQSSYYINHTMLHKHGFNWEKGFNVFTHTRSQVSAVYKYIEKQKDYHRDIKFKEEYLNLHEMKEEESIDDSIFKYKYQ